MLSKLRSRLTAAHLIALVALFFAIGGPSFAANTVSSAAKLITGKQIKNGSLSEKDLSKTARAKLKGRRGPAGAQGVSGPAGAKGDKGDTGDPAVYQRTRTTYNSTSSVPTTTGVYVKARDFQTFTKSQAGTVEKITLQDYGAISGAFPTYCKWQVRVDDLNNGGAIGNDGAEALVEPTRDPVTITSVFTNLSAGTHALSLWVNGDTNETCSINGRGLLHQLLVEEAK